MDARVGRWPTAVVRMPRVKLMGGGMKLIEDIFKRQRFTLLESQLGDFQSLSAANVSLTGWRNGLNGRLPNGQGKMTETSRLWRPRRHLDEIRLSLDRFDSGADLGNRLLAEEIVDTLTLIIHCSPLDEVYDW